MLICLQPITPRMATHCGLTCRDSVLSPGYWILTQPAFHKQPAFHMFMFININSLLSKEMSFCRTSRATIAWLCVLQCYGHPSPCGRCRFVYLLWQFSGRGKSHVPRKGQLSNLHHGMTWASHSPEPSKQCFLCSPSLLPLDPWIVWLIWNAHEYLQVMPHLSYFLSHCWEAELDNESKFGQIAFLVAFLLDLSLVLVIWQLF